MQITKQISIDMANRNLTESVYAVQGDSNTRVIYAKLFENNVPWEIPIGVTSAVAFQKSDGKKGLYDALPDGTKAVTFEGNTVTAFLAPQMLTCPGNTYAAIIFHDSNLNQLATFPFAITVAQNPSAGQIVSNDYYSYSTMKEVNEAVDAALADMARAHVSMEKIRWNQMVGGDETNSHNGITVAKNGTKITVTGTANADAYPHLGTIRGLTGGHIILLRMPKLQGVRIVNLFEYDANGTPASSNYIKVHYFPTGTIKRITLQPTTEKMWVGLSVPAGTLDTSGYMNCFDLTEMFGAGNEPTNEEFFRLYPAENYAYCAPVDAPAPYLSIIRGMSSVGTVSNLAGKKFLIMGDSLSAANKWQKELEAKGATYTNHCLGGAGITTIVDGGSNSNGTLAPLTVDEVAGKDAIIFFGGQNNHKGAHGKVGDIYPTNATVAGYMQYAINKIYALLTEAGNLTCRVMVVTPYCFGASDYNTDAFQNDGVGLAQIIEDVANYNGIPVWNAYKNSGINPTTLAVWGAAANDKVHLNSAGYAHLGKLIAEFADRNVLD